MHLSPLPCAEDACRGADGIRDFRADQLWQTVPTALQVIPIQQGGWQRIVSGHMRWSFLVGMILGAVVIGVVIGLAKTLPTPLSANEIDVLLPGTIVALSVGLLVYLYRRRQHWWDRGWNRERFFAILTSADALFYLVLFLIGVVALMH